MKHQLFADYLQRLEDLQHRLYKEVQDLPAEAMDWSPGRNMNSTAVLLAHIAGLLREGIDLALDEPPSRVRAQEFQTRGVLSGEMLRRLDAVIDFARGALPPGCRRRKASQTTTAQSPASPGITCEIAESAASIALHLRLSRARTPGFDAHRVVGRRNSLQHIADELKVKPVAAYLIAKPGSIGRGRIKALGTPIENISGSRLSKK